MSKIAVIGPDNLFGGFKTLGIEIFSTTMPDEAKEILEKISRTKEYGIIFLLESLAIGIKDIIERISRQTSPSLVILPGTGECVGCGVNRIRDLVRKASGQDIG